MWLQEPKSVSQENVKGSSSESPPPSVSSKAPDSFILEPDVVLANNKKFFPDEEIATNFASLLAGHIMKKMESTDCQKKVYIKRPIIQKIEKPIEQVQNQTASLASVEIGKCQTKKKQKKRRSRIYRSFSIGSKQSKTSNVSKSIMSSSELETVEEEVEGLFEENEFKILTEEEALSQLLASCNPKSYLHSYYMERKLMNWTFKERDQNVEITFRNGNRYTGRISRMQMEGEGKFIWNDGTIYKGTFKNGNAHGSGEMFWPDGSWYEGQMSLNKRKGHGISCKSTPYGEIYYYGEWNDGKKHGKGKAVYSQNNWYDGDWKYGKRWGFGIRYYETGAIYCGQWYNGFRMGRGTMIWPNNDIYTGCWKMGFMDKMGTYTWKAFRNSKFVAPMLNVFKGNFFEGRRRGFGHLRLATGASIYTTWLNREKSGNGEIICRNGNRIYARNLFFQDRSVKVDLFKAERYDLPDDIPDDIELLNLLSQEDLRQRVKPRSIDVNGPIHKMDFNSHIDELFKIDYRLSIPPSPGDPVCTIDQSQCDSIRELENTWLQKVIMKRMPDLNLIYNYYATIGINNEMPNFKIAMLRIMLYQLLRDCGIRNTKYSCVDLDLMVGIGTNPFDIVLMYEMIHYLLKLCTLTRMNPRTNNKEIPGVLAGTFDQFIDEVVMKSKDIYNGMFLESLRLMPLKPIYKLYKSLGTPLRIDDLCAKICDLKAVMSDDEPFTPEMIMHTFQGNNAVCVDGTFSYVPYEEDYFDLKKESLKHEETPFAKLTLFEDIGLDNVAEAIRKAVPDALNPFNVQLNGNYLLSFLDFCDILANLSGKYIEQIEEFIWYKKKESEVEMDENKLVNSSIKVKTSSNASSKMRKRKSVSTEMSLVSKRESYSKKVDLSSIPWLPKKFVVKDLVDYNSIEKYM